MCSCACVRPSVRCQLLNEGLALNTSGSIDQTILVRCLQGHRSVPRARLAAADTGTALSCSRCTAAVVRLLQSGKCTVNVVGRDLAGLLPFIEICVPSSLPVQGAHPTVSGSPTEKALLSWGLQVRPPCGATQAWSTQDPCYLIGTACMAAGSELCEWLLLDKGRTDGACPFPCGCACAQMGLEFEGVRRAVELLHVEPFNSARKSMAVLVREGPAGTCRVHWKGAAEILLAACARTVGPGHTTTELTEDTVCTQWPPFSAQDPVTLGAEHLNFQGRWHLLSRGRGLGRGLGRGHSPQGHTPHA